jgi:pimeloyl-ACP methyl ester carboxylesterase
MPGGNSLPAHRRSLMARLRTLAVRLLIALIAVAAVAWAIESARMYRLAHHAPPGELLTVDGYQMHLDCVGEGSPTLVLEAGLGDDFLSWRRVQPELSKTTRVCSYDRAGYGWSAPRPGPRDTDHIARELHGLLTAARITGPIVLMGHSAGGLFIRKYAALYPDGIAGLIFVDASTPTQVERLPARFRIDESFLWDKLLLPFGVTRMRDDCGEEDAQTPAVNDLMRWHDCRLSVFRTVEDEEKAFPASCNEAKHTGPFPAARVLIFSQDPAENFGNVPLPLDVRREGAATWNDLQEELKQLSPHSQRIIARGSTHYVQLLRPELVIREVRGFVIGARSGVPPSSGYGTTTTQ